MRRAHVLLFVAALAAACSRPSAPAKEYHLTGQILSLQPDRQEVLIKHDDIKGFMPAMTMPYKVKDGSLLSGKQPGDLVEATLVVGEVDAHLSTLEKTGHAPLDTPPPVSDAPPILEPGQQVPDALLVNQDGAPIPFSSLRGHRVAVTFIYTRCPQPDFCPLMNRNFAAVQTALATDPSLSDVRLLTVTMDPAFDTPKVMKEHAALYKADPNRWIFATGEAKDIRQFESAFGIDVEPSAEDQAQIIHNLRTAIVDANGRLVNARSGNTWKPAELVADLKKTPAPGH
jgi:protein SCO1/2